MNAYYKLYLAGIFRLAATLVIKSAYTAKSLNQRLSSMGYSVNPNDPTTWKYYMNLAGLPHEVDQPMQVISLDTLEVIDFTYANLQIHRATRRGYVYGTDYYKELTNKYPEQIALINGIINPIPMSTSISAADHNILFYDPALVESNEQTLIPQLQSFITEFFETRNNPDYSLVDPYYHLGLLATLYSKIPAEIINIRKSAAKTDHAHSYHVRQYLLSFSPIGQEFDFMSQKQRLFFYRNIRYLNLNIGRQEIFNLMTQKVLTDRGFSLARYDFTHNYENTTKTLVPEIIMHRVTLNGIDPAQGSNTKKVSELLDLELPLNRDNPVVREVSEVDATIAMEKSKTAVLKSKVLESNVVDRTDAEPFTLTEVLLNHWIYLSHYDQYKSVVTFTNPANGDTYKMTVKNAFIFYLYAYNRSMDVTLTQVPVISANRVRRIPLPTKQDLMKLTTRDKVPEYYIDYILDTQVQMEPYVAIETFREACQQIHKLMLSHRNMRHYNGDYIAEGQLHTIIDHCYMDIRIDLANEVDYDIWLDEQGIDVASMGRLEFELMAKEIYNAATGADLGVTTSMRAIHASMIRIMRQMSSYSVQFIPQINDSPIKIIDGKFPKLTIPVQFTTSYVWVEIPWPDIQNVTARHKRKVLMEAWLPEVKPHVTQQVVKIHVPAYVPVRHVTISSTTKKIENPLVGVRMVQPTVTDISDLEVTGIAGYLAVPPKDLNELVVSTTVPGYENLSAARRRRFLSI